MPPIASTAFCRHPSAAPPAAGARWPRRPRRRAARLPIFVGGTGLYLRALTQGLSEIPAVPADVAEAGQRRVWLNWARRASMRELARLDPVMAGRLAPGDSQRIYRAWTVRQATGRSLAEWQAAPPARRLAQPDLRPDAAAGGSSTPPAMRGSTGWWSRARWRRSARFLALGLDPSLPAMKAVGVRELGEVIAGRQDLRCGGDCCRAAGDPALCQASDDLDPAPDAGGADHRSAIFGKNLAGNLYILFAISC